MFRLLSSRAYAAPALLLAASACQAASLSWNTIDGQWSTASNWSPAGPPDIGDIARLGDLPGIANGDVFLDQNDAVAELHITDGMTLSNQDHTFSVIGDTFLSGLNEVPIGGGGIAFNHSRIFIRPTAAPVQFSTDGLVVTDEARVRLHDGGVVEVRGQMSLDSSSSVYGEGGVRFIDSGTVLVNSGTIDPAGGTMIFNVTNGGLIDLDGGGQGRVSLDWGGEALFINGGSLADPFSGEILIDGGAALQMNLDAPWEADQSSVVLFGRNNNGISAEPAVLGGAAATLGGLVETPFGTHGRIIAPVTYAESAVVDVLGGATFEHTNDTRIDGGAFTLIEGANLLFDGPTEVRGGAFTTHSQLSSDGAVRFNGDTTWRGQVDIDGVALQNGDVVVNGLTAITADVFDMDGGGGSVWQISSVLSVTADSIDSSISNTFDGLLLVSGSSLGRVNVNLTGAFDHWTMNNLMVLENDLPFPSTRLSGSPMRMTSQLAIDGDIRVTADVTLGGDSDTIFANGGSTLRLTGATVVEAGARFVSGGTLYSLPDASLLLRDGANTDGSVVRNAGLLRVGDGPGGALADDLLIEESSIWQIEIGGHAVISEHDHLTAIGTVELDGVLDVLLIDAGDGLFLPEIGDAFTVLTSLSPLSGTFQGAPVTFAAGQQFHWDVVYDPNTVTLVLASVTDVVPEPTGGLLLLVAASAVGIQRRR